MTTINNAQKIKPLKLYFSRYIHYIINFWKIKNIKKHIQIDMFAKI